MATQRNLEFYMGPSTPKPSQRFFHNHPPPQLDEDIQPGQADPGHTDDDGDAEAIIEDAGDGGSLDLFSGPDEPGDVV